MKTPRNRIAGIVAKKTLKQGVSKRYSREIAAYLLENRRTGDLDSILRDVQADWAESGHLEVIAASAHELTPAIRDRIKKEAKALYPSAKTVVINEVYDPEIIGGVRLSLPGKQLDLSVEAKLNRFKQLTSAGKE